MATSRLDDKTGRCLICVGLLLSAFRKQHAKSITAVARCDACVGSIESAS